MGLYYEKLKCVPQTIQGDLLCFVMLWIHFQWSLYLGNRFTHVHFGTHFAISESMMLIYFLCQRPRQRRNWLLPVIILHNLEDIADVFFTIISKSDVPWSTPIVKIIVRSSVGIGTYSCNADVTLVYFLLWKSAAPKQTVIFWQHNVNLCGDIIIIIINENAGSINEWSTITYPYTYRC